MKMDGILLRGGPALIRRGLASVPIGALVVIYCLHFYHVAAKVVDVPYWDEWHFLQPGALPSGLTFEWAVAFHNVHRIIPTKLQIYLLYQINGWNLGTQQIMNFLLFGATILCLIWVARTALREYPHSISVICAFSVFFLSTLCYSNHFWGIQSAVHFTIP